MEYLVIDPYADLGHGASTIVNFGRAADAEAPTILPKKKRAIVINFMAFNCIGL